MNNSTSISFWLDDLNSVTLNHKKSERREYVVLEFKEFDRNLTLRIFVGEDDFERLLDLMIEGRAAAEQVRRVAS